VGNLVNECIECKGEQCNSHECCGVVVRIGSTRGGWSQHYAQHSLSGYTQGGPFVENFVNQCMECNCEQ